MFFFTATINSWQNLLEDNQLKLIILNTFRWFVNNKKAAIHGFVIMPNHFHVLWTPLQDNYDIIFSFKSYTGSQFRNYLLENNPSLLKNYVSSQGDSQFNFWKRRSKSIEMMTRTIAGQKLDYLHQNPLQGKWQLCEVEEDYYYSSASYYFDETNHFDFLSRYEDWI